MEDVAQQAQLDEVERSHLEGVVRQLRERTEETVEYWIHTKLNLAEGGAEAPATLNAEELKLRERIEEAIEREQAGERSWTEARDLYVKGVGYTLVNRLAALRCMEVRGFLDRSPTRFRDDGVTPAADQLIGSDYFLSREASIWTAFLVACRKRSEEIELLFDLSDPYSLLYGDLTDWDGEPEELAWSDELQSSIVGLLQDLGGLLDEVEDTVWRADDVLGWVYEYYNMPDLDHYRDKADSRQGLDPDDVPGANQFYTPHWVVRMLTDNSLGKLFLEHQGTLQQTIQSQDAHFTLEERKTRDASIAASVEELCTYLVATEEEGEATDFDHPSEIRVFDPACGSGHFLLYAFDVLERIWWAMEPDIPRSEIPEKILRHNLYGVDLDLRACQLAAFNLYLKARTRAKKHGAVDFDMPSLDIICADAHVADLDRSHEVFDEVAAGDDEVQEALRSILTAFEQVEGIGSLLDVRGVLKELVDDTGAQLNVFDGDGTATLTELLGRLHETIASHTNGSSFRAEDLRSFVRLLVVLSQSYDVTLMNPPFGMRGRMPSAVKSYVEDKFSYAPEFSITVFEQAEKLSKKGGRVGMLIPRSFMFKKTFEEFRTNFVTKESVFDILSEYGLGVLDNATVRTVGTVMRTGVERPDNYTGLFYRLHDIDDREKTYIHEAFGDKKDGEVRRVFTKPMGEFSLIPGSPLSYWVPQNIRSIYKSGAVFDKKNARVDREDHGEARQGIGTGDNPRFVHNFWSHSEFDSWIPLAAGGEDSWGLPRMTDVLEWSNNGKEIRRFEGGNGTPNEHLYFKEGITFNLVKEGGRRFGYLHEESIFSHTGLVYIPKNSSWETMAFTNSTLATYLMVGITTGRHWNVGEVAKLPWDRKLEGRDDLTTLAKSVTSRVISLRRFDFRSPHYQKPLLLSLIDASVPLTVHSRHPHRDLLEKLNPQDPPSRPLEASVRDLAVAGEKFRRRVKKGLAHDSKKIDEAIYEHFGISEDQKDLVELEIALRTNQDPRATPDFNPDQVTEPPEDFANLVKRMVLHLVFEIVEEDDDGIVLLRSESDDEETDLLAKMTSKFEEIWGDYAEDRLQEVDEVLGDRDPTEEPYPNLRQWLENDLFAFQCDEFENTPILWELTTERLSEDENDATGFACLIDYHQLGPDVFDRLSARYLETRKAALRERRQSARRTADGSEGTQAREARQEEKRCESALRQIDALETKISELTQPKPREWAEAVRGDARDLKPKVRRFRERLEERLETLDALHEEVPTSWFKDHFSDKFMESVNGNREEWIDALKDLEDACEQFARPADEPVEAHLYDLLPYFDDLVGSKHHSSNGTFFLNYYFKKGKDLAEKIDQGNKDRVTRRERLVADLARETEEDIELGKEINEACQEMKTHMESDWKPRALEEVQTSGYRPVKKHGVAINITPLAEKKLVPELVEDKVI